MPEVDDVALLGVLEVGVEHDVAVATEEVTILGSGDLSHLEVLDAPDLDLACAVIDEALSLTAKVGVEGAGSETLLLEGLLLVLDISPPKPEASFSGQATKFCLKRGVSPPSAKRVTGVQLG